MDNRATVSVDHYENFPVASLLCPAALRPAVSAIYHFARAADDIADEGDANPASRLTELAEYRDALQRCAAGDTRGRWQKIFHPLQIAIERHGLPLSLLADLLDAFEQDVHNPSYADRAALLGYCRLSANPVGRLLLHLYGLNDDDSLRESDAVCSALQLINFWQDLGIDVSRGRHYVPLDDAHRHGLSHVDLRPRTDTAATRALMRELVVWARELMLGGAPLALRVPGRAGWELRLVVQGGLRILERIEAMNHDCLSQRQSIQTLDAPRLLWRAARMRRGAGR